MSETIVNLTSLLVNRELQNFLAEYSLKHPYRIIFSLPYFRQRLIAKILSQMPNRHVVVSDVQDLENNSDYLICSSEERFTIELLIKKTIPEIFCDNYEQIEQELAQSKETKQPVWLW